MIIYTKEAAPSLGKTYGAVKHIKESGDKWIIASISKELGKQTYKLCKEFGIEKVMIINSDSDYVGGTFNRFKECLRDREADVIIITQVLLEMTYKQGLDFSEYNLLIDEVPNNFVSVDTVHQIKEDETTMIMNYITNTGVVTSGAWTREIYRLRVGAREKLEERVNHLKEHKDNTISSRMVDLYEYLLLGGAIQRWHKDVNEYKVSYCYVKIINPLEVFKSFKRVVLIAANIKHTLVGEVWTNIFNIEFKDTEDIKLRSPVLPNTERITIYPLLKDFDISKYLLNKEYGGIDVFSMLVDKALSIVGSEPYTYVFNTYRELKLKGIKVPVQSHGLNEYSGINNSICLFSYNPSPFTREILTHLAQHFNLKEDIFVQAFITSNYKESSFQNATRGNIRIHDSNNKVKIVVGDMRCAKYLVDTWFTNATIDTNNYVNLPEPDKGGRPKKFQGLFNMDKKESGKFYRMNKKRSAPFDVNSPSDVEFVRNWIKELRGKSG